MSGEGPWAEAFNRLFQVARARAGLGQPLPPLSTEHFRRPGSQPTLF
jgi:hypothetical protein